MAKGDADYERKWFITQESVERAIAEEQARAARHNEPLPNTAEAVRNDFESSHDSDADAESANDASSLRVRKLEKEVMDLKILNGGKDFLIHQLSKEQQLSVPRNSSELPAPNRSEHHSTEEAGSVA